MILNGANFRMIFNAGDNASKFEEFLLEAGTLELPADGNTYIFTHEAQDGGGEGEGERVEVIFSVRTAYQSFGCYSIIGSYYSYMGTSFDDLYAITPVEKKSVMVEKWVKREEV